MKNWEIVEMVKDAQENLANFKRMPEFPWESGKKTPEKKKRGYREDVTNFIEEVWRVRNQKDKCLLWTFKSGKEAYKTRNVISVRRCDNRPKLNPLEIHKVKNKIYARWNGGKKQ